MKDREGWNAAAHGVTKSPDRVFFLYWFGLFVFFFFGVGNEGSFPGRTEAFSVVETHIEIS